MRDIEKNDVDITSLFDFTKEVELRTTSGEPIKVYMKLPNDAQINRARVYAMRESSNLRKNLKDSSWEEREGFIPSVSDRTDEEIVEHIIGMSIQKIGVEISEDLTIPIPKEPDGGASLEEQEQYQQAIDEYPILVNEKFVKTLEKRIESLRTFLQKKNTKELLDLYEEEVIKGLCEEHFYKTYMLQNAFYASFKDPEFSEPLFAKFESLKNGPISLKGQLMEAYNQLEISPDELKK